MIRSAYRKKQLLATLLGGGVALAWSLPAAAQATGPSIALNAQAVVLHRNQDGSASTHNNNAQPSWISHSDCESNVYLDVPLTITGTPLTYPVQVWASAGVDCTQQVNRTGTTSQCWQVAGSVTPTTSLNVHVNAQDIVQYITTPSGQKPASYTPGNATGCDSFSQSGPVAMTLYFMFLDQGGNLIGTDATYGFSVALIGPAAPSNVTAGVGDTLLKISWTPTSDANTQGFSVFCDPPPGQEGLVSDAGSTTTTTTVEVCADGGTADGGFDDAGNYLGDITLDGGCRQENQTATDGGGGGGGTCSSSVIFSGGGTASSSGTDEAGTATTTVTGAKPPPADINKYACGSAGSPTSTSATVQGLKNGQKYVVGVAAFDVVGNVGPMSIPQCEDPTPVDDFWKDYKNAGGGAGGGFCSVDKQNEPASLSAFGIVGFATVVSVWRRRKKKKLSARDSRS